MDPAGVEFGTKNYKIQVRVLMRLYISLLDISAFSQLLGITSGGLLDC